MTNPFVDVEAVQEDIDEFDSEGEGEELEKFVQDDVEDTSDVEHPGPSNRMTRDEDDEGNIQFQELLDRAIARAHEQQRRRDEYDLNDEVHELQDRDMLWEIGCKIGLEKATILKIREADMHRAENFAPCVVSTAIPGRIYVAASNVDQVMKLARSFPALKSQKILPVPPEDLLRFLDISFAVKHWPWARVRGNSRKWRNYAGDTGFVFLAEERQYLTLIPRIALGGAGDGQSQPPQALLDRRSLDTRKFARGELQGSFTYRGQMFSAEGFLLVELNKIAVLPLLQALPSSAELALFRKTPLLSAAQVERIERQIAQARIKPRDRVKVVSGPYLHMIGEVQSVMDNVVSVYLPSQGIHEDMPKDTVRVAFAVGDEVKILDGENKDLEGWVVSISQGRLGVVHFENSIAREVNVLESAVEFHSPDLVSLQPRNPQRWVKLGGRNPNEVYDRIRVMVIGRNSFKGYKGTIKTTTPEGHALVELDSRLQQPVQLKLVDLAYLTHAETLGHILNTGRSAGKRPLPSPVAQLSSSTPSSSTAPVGLTPAWDPSDSFQDLSPAWDPSSRTPGPPRQVHWLDNPRLQQSRIKLKTTHSSVDSPYVEFLGMDGDLAKVRDKSAVKFLPLESISPLSPTMKGDLVVPKAGDMQGIPYNVVRVAGDVCAIRKPGVRPTKTNPDIEFATSDLVQIYPAAR